MAVQTFNHIDSTLGKIGESNVRQASGDATAAKIARTDRYRV